MLKDADPALRNQSARLLGPDDPAVLSALAESLKEGSPVARMEAAEILWPSSAGQEAALPAVRELLASPDANTRLRAVRLLVHPAAAEADRAAATAAAAGIVRAGPAGLRAAALNALAGTNAATLKTVAPTLRDSLAASEPQSRLAAAELLVRVGGEDRAAALTAIAALAADPTSAAVPVRARAQGVLRTAGADGEKLIVPHLVAALGDPVRRMSAATELSLFSSEAAKPALPALMELLTDKSTPNRLMAAQALARVGGGGGAEGRRRRPR